MPEEKTKNGKMVIVLINMIILVSYTLFVRLSAHDAYGIIPLAFIIFWHFAICGLTGLLWEKFRPAFLLSALLVVLIGFSTCVIAFNV
jgi:hypothetical protein